MESFYCPNCTYPNPVHLSSCQRCGASLSLVINTTKSLVTIEENDGLSLGLEQSKHETKISQSDETLPAVSEEWRKQLKNAIDGKESGSGAIQINLGKECETQRLNYTSEEDYILKAGTVHFRGDLILHHVASNMEFIIPNAELKQEIVVGRLDKHSGISPTIDLTNLESENKPKAISRRHFVINEHKGLLVIVDQNSTNGTYLNGQHLVPYQPRVLRDKDILWLGNVKLLVWFRCPKD